VAHGLSGDVTPVVRCWAVAEREHAAGEAARVVQVLTLTGLADLLA
jgi:hypothetical protein